MPTFETPEPISVSLELGVGDVRIAASDRSDTVVEVRPSDPDETRRRECSRAGPRRVRRRPAGRQSAEGLAAILALGRWESIDVEIALPAGSRLDGEAGVAPLHCTGRVDELRYKTGVGEIHLDETGPYRSVPGPVTSASSGPPVGPRSRPAPVRFRSAASTVRQWSRTPTATPGSEIRGRPPRERCERQDRRRPTAVDGRREVRQR